MGPLIGLLLIGLGTGGIKPCVAAFGGDQFNADQVRSQHDRDTNVLTSLEVKVKSEWETFKRQVALSIDLFAITRAHARKAWN